MSLGNIKSKGKKHNKTIKHKTQTVFIGIIILTIIIIKLIDIIVSNVISPLNIIITIVVYFVYIFYVSSFAAGLLSFKFVDQVNRMTGVAKAIANSKNLEKRVKQSSREDELKNLEEALNSMLDKLENSFDKQRRFVSDASHELRTPVSILKGYLDILNEWGLKDEQILKESIESMKEETYHMKKLIENLLFLARADQGHIPLSIHRIELKSIIEKLITDIKLISINREISCEVNEVVQINGDSELILQLLRALAENSIKYTDDDGSIIINLNKKKNYARIDIIDDGIGIPKKDIEKVFERFYRVEEARDKNSGGSGLGLSLVKRIVDMHDGKIEIESQQGKGTKIGILLPISKKELVN